jgi:hypothetical protein
VVDQNQSRKGGFRALWGSQEEEITPGFTEKVAFNPAESSDSHLLDCKSESPRKVFRNYQSLGLTTEPLSQSLAFDNFEKVLRLY